MAKKKIGIVLALDGEQEYKAAITGINKSLGVMKTELSKTKAEFEGQANSIEALKKKQEILKREQSEFTRKIQETRKGLDHAKDGYEATSRRLEELRKRLEEAKKKQDEMSKSGTATQKELKNQAEKVRELGEAEEKQAGYVQLAENRIKDWEASLNTAERQLMECSGALNKNTAYLKEAEQSSDKCATSIDKFGKEVRQSEITVKNFGDSIKEHLKAKVIIDGIRSLTGVLKDGSTAIVNLARDSAAYADNILTASTVTRMSTDDLQAYAYAAELVDVSTETLTKSMSKNVKSMANAKKGTEDYTKAYKRLGVDVTNADGSLRNSELVYWECIDALKSMKDETERDTVSMQIFGKSAQELNPLISQGSEGIAKLKEEAREMGAVLDGDALAALGATDDSLQRLYQSIDIFKRKVGAEMAPVVKDAAEEITDALSGMDDEVADFAGKAIEEAVGVFKWIIEHGDGVISTLKGIAAAFAMYKAVSAITNVISAVKSMSVALKGAETAQLALNVAQGLNPYGLLAAGIAAVTVAFIECTKATEEADEKTKAYIEDAQKQIQANQTVNENIRSGIEERKQTAESIESEWSVTDKLANKLIELNGVEEKSAKQKAQMKSIVDQLSEKIPGLKEAYDEEKGSIELTDRALQDLIETNRDYAMLKGARESIESITKDMFQAEQNYQEALEQRFELQQEVMGKIAELNEAQDKFTAGGGNLEEVETLKQDVKELTEAYEEQSQVFLEAYNNKKELDKQYNTGTNWIKEFLEKTEQQKKSVLDASLVTKEFGESITNAGWRTEGMIKSGKDLAYETLNGIIATEEASSTQEEYADALGDAQEAEEEAAEAARKAAEMERAAADARKDSLQTVKDTYDQTFESIKQDLQDKINPFEKFDGGTDMTTEQMNANLDSQLEGLRNYEKNLEKVKGMVDEQGKAIVSPEFLQYIEDLGPEGAKMLEHMVYTWEKQGEYGAEQIKSLNEKFCEGLEYTDGVAKAKAANEIALKAYAGELGSTELEFDGLKDSVNFAVKAAAEGWADLPDETRQKLDETIKTVQECGGQIPDGLASAIESGEVTPEQAMERLNNSLQGQFDGLVELAKDVGINVPEDLAAGIEAGGDEAVAAYQALIALLSEHDAEIQKRQEETGKNAISSNASGMESASDEVKDAAGDAASGGAKAAEEKKGEYESAGTALMGEMATGVKSASGTVSQAVSDVVYNASSVPGSYKGTFQAAGYNLSLGIANGLIQGSPEVQAAARKVVTDAETEAKKMADEHSPSRVWRDEIGLNLSKGAALGILAGKREAEKASAEMARGALEAAKLELEIKSPSKAFQRAVGAQIPAGMAWGIRMKKNLSTNAAREMSKEVLEAATGWLEKYRKSHEVSLSDEKYFWEKVALRTRKGTAAYKTAKKEIASLDKDIKKISDKFGVSRTKDGKNKDDKAYYSEIYQAANQYMSNKKILREVDLKEEEAYWTSVIKQLKKGTQAWYDAKNQLKSVKSQKKQQAAEEKQAKKDYAVSGGALDTYKTYFNVSAQSEVEYWDIVRRKFKSGTKEREEADQHYFESKEALNEQLKDLEDDYYDKVSEVNEKLDDEIKDLTDSYEDAVKSRADAIYNSFSLTDKFESETDDGATLLYNLKTQVTGLEDWEAQLKKLESKGLAPDFLDELKEMGPEASSLLHVLNNDLPDDLAGQGMTDAQLKEYVDLWKKKKELAQRQAEEENEQLKAENEKKIAELREQAKKEIAAYTEEYLTGVNDLTQPITKSLKQVAENATKWGEETVTNFVQNLSKTSKSENSKAEILKTTEAITKNLSALKREGKTLGAATLDGILEGLNNTKKIKKKTTAMVKQILEETRKAAKIHSPSQLFKEEVGAYIPEGVGEGIEKNTAAAKAPAKDMIKEMLNAARDQQKAEAANLADYAGSMHFDAGIAQLNAALQTPIKTSTNVTVDNGDLAGLMAQTLAAIQGLSDIMSSQQLVMDTGVVAGALQPLISQESAMDSIRRNRGRL